MTQVQNKRPLIERLKDDTPLLGDGAMGTILMERGDLDISVCMDGLNIDKPDLVRAIHLDYIEAGSDIIETNTFGANGQRLAPHGRSDEVAELNRVGVQLVRDAIADSGRDDVYIAGSVGPLGERLVPYGSLTREQAKILFREQISVLIAESVDAILFETFINEVELLLAVEVAQAIIKEAESDAVIIAQATFSADNTTYNGKSPARVAHELYKAGVTVMGVNCGSGPQQLADNLSAMVEAVPNAIFSALPNAGYPENLNGRIIYPATASYFGDYVNIFHKRGASIIGGCCGTTPEHIRAMRQAIDDPQPIIDVKVDDIPIHHPTSDEKLLPTQLAQYLADGTFVVTVEVAPPRSYTAEKVIKSVRLLRDAGADFVDVADTPAAKMKMSAWAMSHLLQDKVGIETVLHFPTRGRNLLRVQGDLLAAHALELRNLFITMGDPARIGDFPDANDAFDIAPSKLISVVKNHMNNGVDMADNSIGQATDFTVGCALNMGADNLDRELRVLEKKLNAGADFALGQPVFEPERIERFHKAYEEKFGEPFTLPMIMGVLPLYSLRHALFLHNEVPGFYIPDHLLKRMEDAGDNASKEGVKIGIELMQQMRGAVQGAYIIPAFGRYSLAAEVCDGIVSATVQV